MACGNRPTRRTKAEKAADRQSKLDRAAARERVRQQELQQGTLIAAEDCNTKVSRLPRSLS